MTEESHSTHRPDNSAGAEESNRSKTNGARGNGHGSEQNDGAEEHLADESADAAVSRLARMPPLQYELVRLAEADRLGVRAAILDRMVQAARDDAKRPGVQGRPLDIPPPQPWPESVDADELLAELVEFFAAHLYVPSPTVDVLALWTLLTYCFESFTHTPRLIVKSIVKGSGKTTVLELLRLVVNKPLETASISPAALFRTIEKVKPTVLMDETDTYVPGNDHLRGILNAGFRRGGQIVRCVGEDQEPRVFDVFAPVALAGLGELPGTIEDRSICFTVRRPRRGELPQPIRHSTEQQGARLARHAARWVADHAVELAETDPNMGDLHNRRADVWRPIYAIATAAGGRWPDLARHAMEALTREVSDDSEDFGVKLLRDVRTIFAAAGEDELPTGDLVRALQRMEDRPWPEMGTAAKPITPTRFTRLVKPFGAVRCRLSLNGRPWGYRLGDFADAFERYLDA